MENEKKYFVNMSLNEQEKSLIYSAAKQETRSIRNYVKAVVLEHARFLKAERDKNQM